MIGITYISVFANLVTLSAATYLFLKLKKLKSRPQSVEIQEFLRDLMGGGAVLSIKCINPGDLLIRTKRN